MLPFVFFSTATRSRDHGGHSNVPPPSRRWKIQRPSRARDKVISCFYDSKNHALWYLLPPTASDVVSLLRSRSHCGQSMWITPPCFGGVSPRSPLHWCFTITIISMFFTWVSESNNRYIIMHDSKYYQNFTIPRSIFSSVHKNRKYPSTGGDGGKSGSEKCKILEYLLRVYVHRGS